MSRSSESEIEDDVEECDEERGREVEVWLELEVVLA